MPSEYQSGNPSLCLSSSACFCLCSSLSLPLSSCLFSRFLFRSMNIRLLPETVNAVEPISGLCGLQQRAANRSTHRPSHSPKTSFTHSGHPKPPPNAIWAFGLGNSISTIEEERGSAFVCSSLDLIVALELILCFSVSFSASKSPSISPSLFLNLLIYFCLSPFISLSAFRLLHHLSLVKSSSLHFC